jgi:hypothetical protein
MSGHFPVLFLRFMSVYRDHLKDHFQNQELRYRDNEIFYKTIAQVTNKNADEIEDPYVQFYYYLDQMLAHLSSLVHIPLLTNSF